MKLHHLISDGWSQVLLCNKLQKIYLDLLEGRTVQLPPAPEYRLHVSEEQQYLQSAACRKDEAYWAALFEQSCRARPRSSRFTARRSARWESAKAICCPKVSAMR